MKRLRLLHAIHDFLPRHRAGSEIYAFELCRELSRRHDVFVVTAEYDPATPHGTIRWRAYEGLPVVEIVNNWETDRFDETYASSRITSQLIHVLEATQPHVLHVHNLLNLSFDLPRHARARGIATAATLHDYTLVCPSGGQRVHVAESHICHEIDPVRCSRCFAESHFHGQMVAATVASAPGGGLIRKAATAARRLLPAIADAAARRVPWSSVTPADISLRLLRARQVFDQIELAVSPSAALAREYVRLGWDERRITVSDYGFTRQSPLPRLGRRSRLTIGFVGTMAWHKGAHVLIEAVRRLRGSFDVVIAGDPNVGPEYYARLKRAAAGLPVRFEGAFDGSRVPEIYANLDVLVVSSLWLENSPLVIHEAFIHGVAVVGARLGGIPELIEDDVNGFTYDAYSPDDLATVLQRFIDDPSLAGRLASRAPAVKSMAEDARNWESRYDALLASRAAGHA
jgi:glycosyltransferase involved in cell wall biosynthesis